jgi:hypothetical protein
MTAVCEPDQLQAQNAARSWSTSEVQQWNQHKVHMQSFHNHFRQSFEELHMLADSYDKYGISLQQYIGHALMLPRQLTMHHTIEDRYWFPVLAERMPEFTEDDQHAASHHLIHEALDALEAWLKHVKRDEKEYSTEKMKEMLQALGKPLFKHLGEEETSLGMENMQKYWTLDEVNGLLDRFHSRYGT